MKRSNLDVTVFGCKRNNVKLSWKDYSFKLSSPNYFDFHPMEHFTIIISTLKLNPCKYYIIDYNIIEQMILCYNAIYRVVY